MTRWQDVMPERDRAVYEKAGFTQPRPFGRNPALLVIDVTIGFIGSQPANVLQSVEEFRTSCGDVGWDALPKIRRLLDAFREKQLRVVYTRGNPVGRKFLTGVTKASFQFKDDETYDEQNQIAEAIAPRENEWVLDKNGASGFFCTPLAAYLHQQGVDSVVVTGCVTSGCVRATVVDAHSFGFRTFVVEDCVFDRAELSHLVGLYEMNAKYADVITLADVIERVREL